MIALAPKPFEPTERQKAVKKILEGMTGLGVHIVPFTAPIGEGMKTVNYLFKCKHSEQAVSPDAQAKEIHAFHDYIRKILMEDTGATHDHLSIAHVADPDDLQNSMWPTVCIRFSDVMGTPFPDSVAYRAACDLKEALQRHIQRTVRPPQLTYYQKSLREGSTFQDAYANELGR